MSADSQKKQIIPMKNTLLFIILLGSFTVLSVSCTKYLTVEPEGAVLEQNNFKSEPDAIYALNGLYGLMLPLVDQIFLAGEARADLVVGARGADQNILELTENRVTSNNPYTDYSKFYRLILACNRTLTGLNEILKADPVNYNRAVYLSNCAEVYYIRSWTYLQLVKIWGDVPFITSSITSYDQIKDLAPEKSATIIKRILKDAQENFNTILTINHDGANNDDKVLTMGQFRDINGRCLLAELYVYDGNYSQAWEIINPLAIMSHNGDASETGIFGMFWMQWGNWHILYDRSDLTRYIKGVSLSINFDATKNQTNSLQRWTNNKYGGIYALKPSSNAIHAWSTAPMMLQQYQTTSAGYYVNEAYYVGANGKEVLDDEGNPALGGYGDYIRGEKGSYLVDANDTLIFKYITKKRGVALNPLINDKYSDNDMFFNIYTDGWAYLFACEILNNMGMPNQALTFLNGGMYYAYVYKSTRYRVGLMPFKIDPNGGDAIKQVNKFILEESALDGAFEGRRWFDLVRFAKRSGDPSLLIDNVAKKFSAGQQSEIISRLSDQANWYLPVYKQLNR